MPAPTEKQIVRAWSVLIDLYCRQNGIENAKYTIVKKEKKETKENA